MQHAARHVFTSGDHDGCVYTAYALRFYREFSEVSYAWNTVTSVDVIRVAADLGVAVGVCAGVGVAWKALSTWKTEFRFRQDYELAERVLGAMYTVRDAINAVCVAFSDVSFENAVFDVDERRRALNEAAVNLDVELQKARILWGDTLDAHKTALKECVDNVRRQVRAYNRCCNARKRNEITADSFRERLDTIKSALGIGDDAHFPKKVREAVRGFEEALTPHLAR